MKDHPEYQYLNLLQEALDKGVKKVDRGTDIVLYSLFGRQTRYDLSKGFPLLTSKKVYWKGVLHELYWFMSGQTNIKYLVDNRVHIWDDYPYKIFKLKNKKTKLSKDDFVEKIATDKKFAKKWGELPKIYGEMWRYWPTRTKRTIDQLQWVIDELKEDPDAKNLIVNSWNPEYLYTMAAKKDASRFPICHNMYQISQRDGKLSLQLYQRSADLFLGVPFNIASYSLLTIILAKVSGFEPGEFIHTFGDVHVYENHIDQVKEQLKRKPRAFPRVKIDKSVRTLDDFRPELVTLENYDPHPAIRGELTIAGGFYDTEKESQEAIPSVGALVLEGQKVLLVKHKKGTGHLPGIYGLPSGLISGKETEKGAAIRKLHEETGLKTTKNNLVTYPGNFFIADIERSDGTKRKFSIKVFNCLGFEGVLKESDETKPEWVSFSDLDKFKLLPNVKKAVLNGLSVMDQQNARS